MGGFVVRHLRAAFNSVLTVVTLVGGRWNPSDQFAPGVCERVEPFLKTHIVGQDWAISQLSDALCSHVHAGDQTASASKPLVISIHGPPGVGKTYTHMLLARALYNKEPGKELDCPGTDCEGAKVITGLDFMLDQQQSQLAAVQHAILDHIRRAPDPLIVIEEYDKMDCATRAMLRQMIEHAWQQDGNAMHRAVFILESNVGYMQLQDMLVGVQGDRSRLLEEDVERMLKDALIQQWRLSACEEYLDTIRFASAVDLYLPYYPLRRQEIEQVMSNALKRWSLRFMKEKMVKLEWTDQVVTFLTNKIDFDGQYPLEGAKQVDSVATRHLGHTFRNCSHSGARAASRAPTVTLAILKNHVVGTCPHALSKAEL